MMEPAQGKSMDQCRNSNQGEPPQRQQQQRPPPQRQNISEFSHLTMVRAQPVFPEVDVKLEPGELITVKEEEVEDEPGSSQEAQNIDKGNNATPEKTGQVGGRRIPPPPPKLGPIRLKPKRYKYSPYEIDPKLKWSNEALPFVSRPDVKNNYAARRMSTASATVTSAASVAPVPPNTTGPASSGSQCNTVDLSVFASFLGKPLFAVKMPPRPSERSASATTDNQNPNPTVLPNPLAKATTLETTTETTVVTGERRQPRRPKSPSLLTE